MRRHLDDVLGCHLSISGLTTFPEPDGLEIRFGDYALLDSTDDDHWPDPARPIHPVLPMQRKVERTAFGCSRLLRAFV